MAALRALEAKVFRPSMPDEYPQLFNEDTYEGLTVCFDGSRCVSHAGMVTRGASIFGCRVDVGLIGGVATDPEYRGQGLAGGLRRSCLYSCAPRRP
jgi:GNAT superfamily N-acetyltransferase